MNSKGEKIIDNKRDETVGTNYHCQGIRGANILPRSLGGWRRGILHHEKSGFSKSTISHLLSCHCILTNPGARILVCGTYLSISAGLFFYNYII